MSRPSLATRATIALLLGWLLACGATHGDREPNVLLVVVDALFPSQPGAPDAPTLAQGNFWGPPLSAWQSGAHKLLVTATPGEPERVELYAPRADPLERRDLAADEPEVLTRLRAELAGQWTTMQASQGDARVELSEQEIERLRSLGYIGNESAH